MRAADHLRFLPPSSWPHVPAVLLVLLALFGPSLRGDPLGPTSRRTSWVISEIMPQPAPRTDGRNLEFVEVHNAGLIAEDLGGHRLAGDIRFVVPPNTVVPAGGFVVIAAAPDDFAAVHSLDNVLGGFTGRLGSAGSLRLHNPAGALLLQVDGSADPPWPASAAGGGHSLVLDRPSYGELDPRAWSASVRVGGSPGRAEPSPEHPLQGLMINEILAHTDAPQLDFIELHNHTSAAMDLAGCRLTDDPARPGFMLPAGTRLGPGGFLAFDERQLGFALNAAGETLFLYSADGLRVVDALRFGPQANGVAFGRFPDGASGVGECGRPTPGLANAAPLRRDVVISEIMYHPISEDTADEFVELHNRGPQEVDLSGWRFVAGIDFEFPSGTRLAPGGYLAVARDVSRLLATHPTLGPDRALGNFRGTLSDGGERLALAMPEDLVSTNALGQWTTHRVHVVVGEVTYGDGGRWGEWSDGGGSSLELRDPRADPRLAANWADSDESGKAPWTTIAATGTLDLGAGAIDQLQLIALARGSYLVDNVEVLGSGANLVANATFDSGIAGWTCEGTQGRSVWDPAGGAPSPGCLRVEAVARGDTGANRIRTPLTTSLAAGSTATLRARVRWLRGHPEYLLRLRGNYLEAVAPLEVPADLGSPGARNSRAIANTGPALHDLTQSPVLPAAGQSVTVTIRADDPDGLGALTLRYRLDPGTATTDVPLRDDGLGADAFAGDGLFTATLPGQVTGRLAAFQVLASDAAVPAVTTTFPAVEALIRWGEARPAGTLGTYRIWMTQATFNRWQSRAKLDNTPLPVTFVYNGERVVHGVGAMFAGSPHISPGYNTPSGNLCGYTLVFPADEPFLGASDVVLDWPGRDTTAQQEPMAYWIARELGIPFNHRRFIRLHVNGVTETTRGSIYEDAQQVNSDLVASWNPDAGGDGDLYKIEQWFEFSDSLGTAHVGAPRLENYTTTRGARKLAPYRWSWLRRAVGRSASDYRSLFTLVDAANATDPEIYPRQLLAFADIEEWMRIIATENIVVNLDSWGYDIGKNMYAFKPAGGRWQLHMWDIDWVMLASAQHGYSPISPLMYRGPAVFSESNRDPVVGRMFNDPAIQRAYWRAIDDAIRGPLRPEAVAARMDATYAALVAQGVTRSSGGTLTGPGQVKTWLSRRRDFLIQQLAAVNVPFTVVPPRATLAASNVLRLSGTAPTRVAELRVDDSPCPVTWSTVSNWTATVTLPPGAHTLSIVGFDRFGGEVAGARGTAAVAVPSNPDAAPDAVVINEIQYHPAIEGAAFMELFNRSSTTAFDLSGWELQGTGLTFPPGTQLLPNAYLVAANDRQALAEAHGIGTLVAAEFPGRLDNHAETIALSEPTAPGSAALLIDRVAYEDSPPWPVAADGSGASLQLRSPGLDNRRPASWATAGPPSATRVPLSLIPLSATWRYQQSGADLGTAWKEPLDSDGSWPEGGALLYKEDAALPAPKVTPLTLGPTTFYFRTRFRLDADPATIPALALTTVIDDGAVVYLNGTEVFRLGMADSGPVTAATLSARNVSDATREGPFTVPAGHLRRGDNVLAAEVHQIATTSSDVVFGIALDTMPAPSEAAATPGRANSIPGPVPTLFPLWLNEVQPDNRTGLRDRAGDADPWVEILNSGASAVDLSACSLSDSPTNLARWFFPAGTTLAPGGRLLAWLDGEPAESATNPTELHSNFRLPPAAGFLALAQSVDGLPLVLDYLHFGGVGADHSVALLPDGSADHRLTVATPTPGFPNSGVSPPVRVVFNEWLAANRQSLADPADGDFEDWFELYNQGDQPADLTGFSLTDDPTQPRKFSLPPGTRLPPRGFLLAWADEEGVQFQPGGALHVSFKLNQSGEFLALIAPDGTIADQLTFGPQTADATGGRWPDGGPVASTPLARATPGAPNSAPVGQDADLTILGILITPDARVTLSWTSAAGSVYRLQTTTALQPAAWQDQGPDIPAAGPITSTTAATGWSDQADPRFYRVIRIPAPPGDLAAPP